MAYCNVKIQSLQVESGSFTSMDDVHIEEICSQCSQKFANAYNIPQGSIVFVNYI